MGADGPPEYAPCSTDRKAGDSPEVTQLGAEGLELKSGPQC